MKKDTNQTIILASSSPRRIEMMQNLGLRFEIMPADIDEVASTPVPAEMVAEIAYLKAKRVQEMLVEKKSKLLKQPHVILAADTTVVLNDRVLGKPNDRDDAIAMLTSLSQTCHQVYTGVHIIDCQPQQILSYQDVGMSRVYFRRLARIEIEKYVDTGEPMDKAGAYAVQGIGSFMVEKIDGCLTNIVGLPLPQTISLLRKCRISIFGC